MANDILTIDGVTYAVNIVDLDETSEFVDKYAERSESWELLRELAGIFFNYELTLGEIQDQEVMQSLWTAIHTFEEFHTVTLPHDTGTQTFDAYVTGCSRKLKKRKNKKIRGEAQQSSLLQKPRK